MKYHKHSYRHLRNEMYRIWRRAIKHNPSDILVMQEYDISLYRRPHGKQDRKVMSKMIHDRLYNYGII